MDDAIILQVTATAAGIAANSDSFLAQVFLLPRTAEFMCCGSDERALDSDSADDLAAIDSDDRRPDFGLIAFCPFSKISAEGSSSATALEAWRRAAIVRFGPEIEPYLTAICPANLLRRKIWSASPASSASSSSSSSSSSMESERFLIDFSFLTAGILFDPTHCSAQNISDWRTDAGLSAVLFDMKVECTPFVQLPAHFYTDPIKVTMTPHFCN